MSSDCYTVGYMTLIESIFLGALEGFTEFLPISSTGHLILASQLFGIESTEALKSFQIAIQLGAILAVVVLYYDRFFDKELLKRLAIAFLPTGVLGLVFYSFIKEYLIGNGAVVAWALIAGGVAMVTFEAYHREPKGEDAKAPMTMRTAFFVGLFQAIAMIPGVSRSAATIIGGLSLGMSRVAIVEFSFLLAVPTMLAATSYDLLRSAHLFTFDDTFYLIVGFLVSFAVARFSMRLLLKAVRRYGFAPFGYYRIVLGAIFLIYILP